MREYFPKPKSFRGNIINKLIDIGNLMLLKKLNVMN